MRRSVLSTIAVSAAVATAAATTSAISSAGAAEPAPVAQVEAVASRTAEIDWGRCSDKDLRKAKARCGFLRVPMDHTVPEGRTLKIAVSRIKATAAAGQRRGPLLSNPGGPGGSGLTLPLYLKSVLPKDLARSYDLIGFDPRGVGASKPSLHCRNNPYRAPQPDYQPKTAEGSAPGANERAWLKRAATFAKACGAEHGRLLEFVGSQDVVADMDRLREALGAGAISYYGFSYGTVLGQLYATEYPERVRRMVLDGNVDATDWGFDNLDDQAQSFQRAMNTFFRWVAKHDKVYGLGVSLAEVHRSYSRVLRTLTRHHVGRFGPADFTDVLTFSGGYAEFLWPETASMFARLAGGETGPFRTMAADFLAADPNGTAVINAVSCLDNRWPDDYDDYRDEAFDNAADHPIRAWADALSALPCRTWPVEGRSTPDVGGLATPELLLVNTTGDGVTPYANAVALRARFPRSVLLAQRGSIDHTAGLAGNACVDRTIFRYLRDGDLPARKLLGGPDRTCGTPSKPKPLKKDRREAGRNGLAG